MLKGKIRLSFYAQSGTAQNRGGRVRVGAQELLKNTQNICLQLGIRIAEKDIWSLRMCHSDIARFPETMIGIRPDDSGVRVLLGNQTAALICRVIVDNGD